MPHISTESNIPHIPTESNMTHISTESNMTHISTESNMPHIPTKSNMPHIPTESNMTHIPIESNMPHISTEFTMPHIPTESNMLTYNIVTHAVHLNKNNDMSATCADPSSHSVNEQGLGEPATSMSKSLSLYTTHNNTCHLWLLMLTVHISFLHKDLGIGETHKPNSRCSGRRSATGSFRLAKKFPRRENSTHSTAELSAIHPFCLESRNQTRGWLMSCSSLNFPYFLFV